ncbi:MAG TPA: RDD family protein [Verrucomicrobiota bacterium]|nr:RDD family protein [Verrucomicrobiota bacterium]HNU52036.1 RDD family protein [Verrucomicrobiota bacterium]
MTDETISIATPDHGTLEFEIAGLGSRFAAHLVDLLLIGLLMGALVLIAVLCGLGHALSMDDFFRDDIGWERSWGIALLILALFLVLWGYYVFFETLMRGSTPGKRHFGVRVIREDGLPIGFREAALRNLVRAADGFPPPTYVLGGIVLFLDRHGRRLGDMVAGTLVVRERFELESSTAAGAAWAARVESGRSRQAVTLPGGTLSAGQIDLIEQFLNRRFELAAARRDALAWHLTAPLLELMGETRAAWEHRPDRTAECERLLLELIDRSRRAPPAASRVPAAAPARWF